MFNSTDQHGFTLLEVITAALIFSLVGLAIGGYYVFCTQRVEEGIARAELQRNSALVIQAIGDTIRAGRRCLIPAEGESEGESSVTVQFPAEPFEDENLNGQWDASGAQGGCAPQECYQDFNENGQWDAEVRPARSFRLNQGRLELREGGVNASWEAYLDDRYPEDEWSSVGMKELRFWPDVQDRDTIHCRFVLVDDRRTSGDQGDDLREAVELSVRRQG